MASFVDNKHNIVWGHTHPADVHFILIFYFWLSKVDITVNKTVLSASLKIKIIINFPGLWVP